MSSRLQELIEHINKDIQPEWEHSRYPVDTFHVTPEGLHYIVITQGGQEVYRSTPRYTRTRASEDRLRYMLQVNNIGGITK